MARGLDIGTLAALLTLSPCAHATGVETAWSLPPPLAPAGKWTVEYHPKLCIAMRDFGPPDAPVTIGLRPWPLSDSTELVLVMPGKRASPKEGKATLGIDDRIVDGKGRYVAWQLP